MRKPKHPQQPISFDKHGVARFKKNAIVDWLFMTQRINLNEIALDVAHKRFPVEDVEQFWQLLGYSVDGYADLSFIRRSTVKAADQEVERLLKEDK